MKINTNIWRASMVILILVFVFASVVAVSPAYAEKSVNQAAISNYLAVQANPVLSDEEKIKAAIDAYFTTRYEGQKVLQAQDFSILTEDNTLDWVKKEKDKRDIELYIASLFDLGYKSYSFDLNYVSVDVKNNRATVQLLESHKVVFTAIAPEVSELADLPHTLTLHNKKGVWVIYKDEYDDELSKQFKHMTKDEIKQQVDKSFSDQQSNSRHSLKVLAASPNISSSLNTYTYNRSAAVSYANTYWSTYNTAWYKTNPGTDCANYVAQSLYAGQGKTPTDTSGMAIAPRNYNTDWYYIFNSPKNTQNGSGSLPWVRVADQYNLILGNTNKIGPMAYGGANYLCNVSAGDVVQLKGVNTAGVWDHTGIIVSATGPCTDLSKYTVNAHTTNRHNYPLSNWASYARRYLIITGWKGN